jgi:hypothetical protein
MKVRSFPRNRFFREGVLSRIFMEKKGLVRWLIGLRIRNKFSRTHESVRHENSLQRPRNRRVTAKCISGCFGVSGV